jgi:hypothetical protein
MIPLLMLSALLAGFIMELIFVSGKGFLLFFAGVSFIAAVIGALR